MTFYNPDNPIARDAIREGREAGRQLGVSFIEFLINLRTAQELGIAIPTDAVQRADGVVR